MSRVAPVAPVMMADDSKATVVGAAAVGGILGVYLFGELSWGVLLATTFAYGATTTGTFGDVTKTVGSYAGKAYDKTLELNEEYDLLMKAKSAADAGVNVAENINENYGITSKIDEQLKLTQAAEKVTAKVDELKSSVSDIAKKASA